MQELRCQGPSFAAQSELLAQTQCATHSQRRQRWAHQVRAAGPQTARKQAKLDLWSCVCPGCRSASVAVSAIGGLQCHSCSAAETLLQV